MTTLFYIAYLIATPAEFSWWWFIAALICDAV